jgi:hypothetical protein
MEGADKDTHPSIDTIQQKEGEGEREIESVS